MEHLLEKVSAFENTAAIIHAQVPHCNCIWMKNFVNRDVGHEVIDIVGDICHFKETGQKQDMMWAKGEGRGGK